MVQTIGSAGESVAAGAIFTLPALFLWAAEGKMNKPSIIEITIIALIGGLLGVLFMIPLRNALIVKEHGVLPYPEGTACAEVLLAGEEGGASAKSVFASIFPRQRICRRDRNTDLPGCYECWLHLWSKNFFLHVCRWYCELAGAYPGNRIVWQ